MKELREATTAPVQSSVISQEISPGHWSVLSSISVCVQVVAIGDLVGILVGIGVGAAEGSALGIIVGAFVGGLVGALLGATDGIIVG